MSDRTEGKVASAAKFSLFLLSVIYFCAIKVILFIYRIKALRSYRPRCKVISVGNITLGGTGKTPLVTAIARRLKDSGKRPAILIRGYKGNAEFGTSDEAELLRRHLPDIPILVGRDRIRTAKEAVGSYGVDIILLDDGFQHWRLDRDMDIVTLDIRNPFGNGKLIPRGILREPLSSLKRAGIFIFTKAGYDGDSVAKAQVLKNRIGAMNKNALIFTSSYIPTLLRDIIEERPIPISEMDGKPVALICAIADPESFEETVKSLGARVALRSYFLDHHKYTAGDMETIFNECKDKDIETIITTEKDVPKLANLVRSPRSTVHSRRVKFLTLGIEIKIDEEERFFGRLFSIFDS